MSEDTIGLKEYMTKEEYASDVAGVVKQAKIAETAVGSSFADNAVKLGGQESNYYASTASVTTLGETVNGVLQTANNAASAATVAQTAAAAAQTAADDAGTVAATAKTSADSAAAIATAAQTTANAAMPKTDIVQDTGAATDKVMSQKAVTEKLAACGDMKKSEYASEKAGVVKEAKIAETATSSSFADDSTKLGGKLEGELSVANSAKLGDELPAYYGTATAVQTAQATANDAASVATTAQATANAAMPKTDIVQETGAATDKVMSQKAVTEVVEDVSDEITAFKEQKDNPHGVTKAQVGLGNVDNTSDANKPVSAAQAAAIKIIQDDITSHKADAVKHLTAAERTSWNSVTNKVDKITGKQLSTNDYTTAEKDKLEGIAMNANNYIHPSTHPASMITGLPEGDMLKSVYDKSNRGLVDNAAKLGGQLPEWYQKALFMGAITGTPNYNNYKETGYWTLNGAKDPLGDTGAYGILEVVNNSNRIVQRYYNVVSAVMAERTYGLTWSDWSTPFKHIKTFSSGSIDANVVKELRQMGTVTVTSAVNVYNAGKQNSYSFFITHTSGGGYISQEQVEVLTNRRWVRTFSGSAWTAWREV